MERRQCRIVEGIRKNVVVRLVGAAHRRIGTRFRQRPFAQSLRHPTEPHEPPVLSPWPGSARTEMIEREVSEGAAKNGRPKIIEETRQYIRDFDRVARTTTTARGLYDKMLELYPDRVNPGERSSFWRARQNRNTFIEKGGL